MLGFIAMLGGINIDTIKAGPVSISGITGMMGTKIARLVRKQKVLMYPYMTLADETEIIHSQIIEKDGMEVKGA